MSTIEISEQVIWDNDLTLWEQSQEARAWYDTNIEPLLSYAVPAEVKQDAVDRAGLQGEFPEDAHEPEKISPSEFDAWARPKLWKFYFEDKYRVEIEPVYNTSTFSWAREAVKVTISNL